MIRSGTSRTSWRLLILLLTSFFTLNGTPTSAGEAAGPAGRTCAVPAPHPPAAENAPAMIACDAGGEGAQSCDTHTTIGVGGFGGTEGCAVTCTNGFYACCQNSSLGKPASCSCRQEVPRGPWTPERPW